MTSPPAIAGAAGQLHHLLGRALGDELPLRLECAWDGSHAGPEHGPTVVIADRRALRRMLWAPGETGLVRAWVAGDIEVPGDLTAVLALAVGALPGAGTSAGGGPRRPRLRRIAPLVPALGRLAGPGLPPMPPPEEAVAGPVRRWAAAVGWVPPSRHTRTTDAAAVTHHYDVGNDFYRLVLGESMTYSCAYWEGAADTLEQAQTAKLELICRKLGLVPGMRLLDVGCGWGSMLVHAARRHRVRGVGVTLSGQQAAYARQRIAAAGLDDRLEVRVQDYRDVDDGPYDAIASIGMAEHVGHARLHEYAHRLAGLLRPGGRVLHSAIVQGPNAAHRPRDPFTQRYVFPDGELQPLATAIDALEDAGLEVRDVQSLREHYARTLRAWLGNLETGWDEALRLVSSGRARVWRLYMAASVLAFERRLLGVDQTLATLPRRTDAGSP